MANETNDWATPAAKRIVYVSMGLALLVMLVCIVAIVAASL